MIENLRDCDMAIKEGSVTRSGAVGTLEPVYFRDPVFNPVEVMEVVGWARAGISLGGRGAPDQGPR